jgi:hypothetical protein
MNTKGTMSFRNFLSKDNTDVELNMPPVSPTPIQIPTPVSTPVPVQVPTAPAPVAESRIKPVESIPSPYNIGTGAMSSGVFTMELPNDTINPVTGEPMVTAPPNELTVIPPPTPPVQPMRHQPRPPARSSVVPEGFVPAPTPIQPSYAPMNMMYPNMPQPRPMPMPIPVPQHMPITHSAIVPPGAPIPTHAPFMPVPSVPPIPQMHDPAFSVPRMTLPSGPKLDGRLPPDTIHGPMITSTGQLVSTEEISPHTVPPIRLDQPVIPSPQGLMQAPVQSPVPVPTVSVPIIQEPSIVTTPLPTPVIPPCITNNSAVYEQIRSISGVVDVASVGNIVVVTVKYKEKTPTFNAVGKKIREIVTPLGLKSTLVSQ